MDDFVLNLFCVVIRHLSYSPLSLALASQFVKSYRDLGSSLQSDFLKSRTAVTMVSSRAHTHKVGRMSDNVEAMVEHPYTLSPNISRTDDE